ncbi:hypothetical protein JXC34_04245 [Candidatus Woesearchaeota archaeon]|nr:hypothetical protein [Candidatus Woesearchaeota archaeon]
MSDSDDILKILKEWDVPLVYELEETKYQRNESVRVIDRSENPEIFQRPASGQETPLLWDITSSFNGFVNQKDKEKDLSSIAQPNGWVQEEFDPSKEDKHDFEYGGHGQESHESVYNSGSNGGGASYH